MPLYQLQIYITEHNRWKKWTSFLFRLSQQTYLESTKRKKIASLAVDYCKKKSECKTFLRQQYFSRYAATSHIISLICSTLYRIYIFLCWCESHSVIDVIDLAVRFFSLNFTLSLTHIHFMLKYFFSTNWLFYIDTHTHAYVQHIFWGTHETNEVRQMIGSQAQNFKI